MANPLVSFVVPVYNIEKYIQECLDSILCQTIQNWECIIVNDGSTDGTLSIVEKFITIDTRFSCITIPNSGAGDVPREKGVSLSKSDWIVYIDGDDYIDPDYLEKVLSRIRETGADMVYVRLQFFSDNGIIHTIPSLDFDMSCTMLGKEALMLTILDWKIGASGALIKRSLWNSRSELSQDKERSKVNLDEYNTRELLILSHKVCFADTNYYYRQHATAISAKMSLKLFYNSIVRDKMLEELIQKHFGMNSSQMQVIRQRRINNLINRKMVLYKYGKELSKKDQKTAKKMIKQYFHKLNKSHLFEGNTMKRILYTKGYTLFCVSIYFRHLLALFKPILLKKK